MATSRLCRSADLAKDDVPDDEDDDDDDDGNEEGDGGSAGASGSDSGGDNSDFNSKHPRWPAGSPDGTGGEFRTKDSPDIGSAPSDDHIDSDPIGGLVVIV